MESQNYRDEMKPSDQDRLKKRYKNHEEHVDLTTSLSLKKFLSFRCFDSRYVVFWCSEVFL